MNIINTEFVKLILNYLFNEKTNNNDIFSNLKLLIKEYKEYNKNNIEPIEISFLNVFIDLIGKHSFNNYDLIINELKTGKFSEFVEYLNNIKNEKNNKNISEDKIINLIINKRKILFILNNHIKETEQIIQKIKNIDFSGEEEIIKDYERNNKKLLTMFESYEINNKIKNGNLFDTRFIDNIDNFSLNFVKSIQKIKTIKTGYNFFNFVLSNGGFEEKRLYLFAGSSGVGKSMFLINFLRNMIYKEQEEESIVYITLENSIDETIERLYCCYNETPYSKFRENLKFYYDVGDIQSAYLMLEKMFLEIKDSNNRLIIKHYMPNITICLDVHKFLKQISLETKIKAIIIDYLDLINSGKDLERRLDQGYVTQYLKNLSEEFECPVITATQLNREGYSKSTAALTQISESLEKIMKSDFVCFLQDGSPKIDIIDSIECKKIKATILKNRNGFVGNFKNFYVKNLKGDKRLFDYKILECEEEDVGKNLYSYKNDKTSDEIEEIFSF